jgi:SAM-dependent methyltransferase
MYRQLSRFGFGGQDGKSVLSISHSEDLCKVLGFSMEQVVRANYPDHNILALPFPDDKFDFVVSDQVLEHVEGNPQSAVDESRRVLKPGGYAIHTTCLINPIHSAPKDFWRFTPDALAFLCREFSRVIEVAGWGNPFAWLIIWLGLRYDGIPDIGWHPLHRLAMHNSANWPIVTWIVAQK